MLIEKEVLNLLKKALQEYIKCLERSDFDYSEYKGQVLAYIKVLNRDDLNVRYLDINKAKELLNVI